MENRLCQKCNQKHAVRCYEEKEKKEFYCLECYSKLFLDGGNEGGRKTVCPRCSTTLKSALASKMVGCSYCYQAMGEGLLPVVQKMQGSRAHEGKTPPLDGDLSHVNECEGALGEEYRAQAVARTRWKRRCHELEVIEERMEIEGNLEGAARYKAARKRLQAQGKLEEDSTW